MSAGGVKLSSISHKGIMLLMLPLTCKGLASINSLVLINAVVKPKNGYLLYDKISNLVHRKLGHTFTFKNQYHQIFGSCVTETINQTLIHLYMRTIVIY